MTVSDTLGGSSSYQTIVSQWVLGQKLTEMFPYLAKFRCGIGNWWQVSGMLRGWILFTVAINPFMLKVDPAELRIAKNMFHF